MITTVIRFVLPLLIIIGLFIYVRRKAGWKSHINEAYADQGRDRSEEVRQATSRIKIYWVSGFLIGILMFVLLLQRDSVLVAAITSVSFVAFYVYFNVRSWSQFIKAGDLQSAENRTQGGHTGRNHLMIPAFVTILVWIILSLILRL